MTLTADVLVVGGGATGALATRLLAAAGIDVLLCEAGPVPDPTDVQRLMGQQVPSGTKRDQHVQSRLPGFSERVAPFFVDDALNPYQVRDGGTFAWIRARNLGGRTLTWGGVTPRLSDMDLRAGSQDAGSPDWPVSAEDLSDSYSAVETLLGVMGAHDGLDMAPDGSFLPPAAFTAAEEAFVDSVRRNWPERHVVHGRGVPTSATLTDSQGHAWPSGAAPLLLPETLGDVNAHAGPRLRVNSVIEKLITETRTGRVIGAQGIDRLTHERFTIHADAIVLCASTIESARILLNSHSAAHPGGVGSSSGALGRYLMDHPAVTLLGTVPAHATHRDAERAGGPHGFYVPRFRNTPGGSASGFLRGYQMWGHAGRNSDTDEARFMLAVCGEMLPDPDNRVTLHSTAVDHWGIPIPVIRFAHGDNEIAMMRDAVEQAEAMCRAAGFEVETIDEHYRSIGTYAHEVGTARMGTNPADSVLDPWNRVWDAPNVLVTDGACWPTSAHQNPTLTMMALTHRACVRLIDEAA